MSAHDWTDQNHADPGITILELFAYLAVLLGLIAFAWRVRRLLPPSRKASEANVYRKMRT